MSRLYQCDDSAAPYKSLMPQASEPAGRDRRSRRLRVLSAAVILFVTATAIPAWSFAHAAFVSNGDPVSANVAEWARSHHLSWLIDRLEHSWYARHQPPTGGTPSGGIAGVAPAASVVARLAPSRHSRRSHATAQCPARIRPLAASPLPGEGSWRQAGRVPGVACFAYLRPDAVHTSVLVGAAWMNMHALRATLHNGTSVPGGGPWRAGPMISPADYPRVVAAFNGGFRLGDSRGGYYNEGRTVRALVPGRASLVVYANGRVGIAMWGRDAVMSPNVVSVRQNLDLLVDNGHLAAGLADSNSSQWGVTLGNLVYTWRSGVGIDAHGNLVYVAGPGLSVDTLATLLQRAGCVRAMELDINPVWTTLMVYSPASSTIVATKLLSDMQRPADRYLHPGTRDFVELDLRH